MIKEGKCCDFSFIDVKIGFWVICNVPQMILQAFVTELGLGHRILFPIKDVSTSVRNVDFQALGALK